MARIAGVDLPKDKRIEIGLTYVYGIGRTSAKKILEMTGINPDTRVKDLTDEDEAKIRECIDHHFIVEEGSLAPDTLACLEREGFALFIVPFRTTAENLAKWFFDALAERGLPVAQVEVYETPNNCAVYTGGKEAPQIVQL